MDFSDIIVGTMRLGSWGEKFDESRYQKFIEQCIGIGATTFDHADIYGDYTTEAEFGNVLRKQPSLRGKMELITKCGIRMVAENRPEHRIKSYDCSKAHIIASVENSLKALGTDYLDLLLLHRPDYLLHPDDVAAAFTQLEEEGKVLSFGVSNFSASQFAVLNASYPLQTNQIELSLLHLDPLDDGTLDQCLQHKISPQAWSPLGGGQLFRSDASNVQKIRMIAEMLCEEYSASMDQIMISWLRQHPSKIRPVLGTSKFARVQSAVEALDIQLSRTHWYELLQAATGKTIA